MAIDASDKEPSISRDRVTFSQFYGEFSEFKTAVNASLIDIKEAVLVKNNEIGEIHIRCAEHGVRLDHIEKKVANVEAGATPKEKAAIVGSYIVVILKAVFDAIRGQSV